MTFIWQKKKKKEFFERTMATDGNRRYSLEADLKMNQTNSSWQPLPSSSWTIFQPQHDIWWSSKTVHNLINMRNISLFNITQTSPNKSWQGGRPPNWGLSLNTQNFLPSVHITSANLIRLYSNFSLNNIIFFHKGKFAHIDQTRLSPVMICNKLVHFANVFLQVLEGRHIDQTLALLCSNISKQVGTIFPVSWRLERFPFVNWTLWVVFKCVVDEICSKMCFLGSLPQGGSRINLGWIPPR